MPSITTPPPDGDSLRAQIAALSDIDPAGIAGDDNLIHLGLGSLEIMRLVTGWRRQGVPADFQQMAATPTLDAWLGHLGDIWPDTPQEHA